MEENYKCKKCSKEFKDYDGLRRHSGRIHKIESGQFYCDFYLSGSWPICKCGCGERVKWYHGSFRKYSRGGHISRIENHWGHNQKAIEKSAETRRKQFASGERTTWCNGLTKDTSESLRRMAENISKSYTDDRKKKSSKLMSQNRKNGIIPTLYGSNHSQWNGGYSRVRDMIYSDKRLYKEWKFLILGRDEFKCKHCGNTHKLHVHHDKETMSDIVHRFLSGTTDEMLKDFKIKRMITNSVVDYHIQNKVSGITLCDKCHEKYHPSLNFT